jgi:chemotaxis protein MotB
MKILRPIFIGLFILFFMMACVSKSKYVELEGDLANTQEQSEAKDREIQALADKSRALENQMAEMERQFQEIEASLKDQIASQQVKLETLEGKLKITFVDKILFNSGSAEINEEGRQTLMSLADTLKRYFDQNIMVEGHTDNVRIGDSLQRTFHTNWELSTARATAVVRFLKNQVGINPERLSAVGYSYYKPIAENDTKAGRAQNRRIEVILSWPR